MHFSIWFKHTFSDERVHNVGSGAPKVYTSAFSLNKSFSDERVVSE